jgi:tryptophanyl-tRNA synthetase
MRIFSGIQPTGSLHIGNYLGAIKHWIKLQETRQCIFSIVDLHAITVPYDPREFKRLVLDTAIAHLALGIDPERAIFFIQSHIKEHAELAWFLNTIIPVGELQRMTQYKDKSKKYKGAVSAGLMNYPVLMAADILLYNTDLVPVGKDQQQHVELTREIARRFNQRFGKTFKEPEAQIPKVGAKIMSLKEPRKKMSKSDNDKTRINLFDRPVDIQKKIAAAVTDTGKEIAYKPQKKPGIANLLVMYSLFSEKPIKQLEKEFQNAKGYSVFKRSLAKLTIDYLEPFRKKQKELSRRDVYVKEILSGGKRKAELIAQSTMQEVKAKMGLI